MKQHSQRNIPPCINRAWRIGIVHSSFYAEEVAALVEGAVKVLKAAGLSTAHIKTYAVPGSFEIPLIGAALARQREADALIGLGIIVQGETYHARLIAEQAARGIMDVQVQYGVPFVFEILFVDTIALARERLDRGEDAARAVLHSLAELRKIGS